MSPVRSILLGMIDAPLLPGLNEAGRPLRCTPSRESRRRPGNRSVTDRLWFENGRRVLTATALHEDEIRELADAARFGPIEVCIRIPTPDARLCAILEPGAPRPSARFASLRAARRAGLEAGVLVAPLLPGVTDLENDVAEVLARARECGATFAAHETVIPRRDESGTPRSSLLRTLRNRYPRVAARCEVRLRTAPRPAAEERLRLAELVTRLARRFGLRTGADAPPVRGDSPGQRTFAFAG